MKKIFLIFITFVGIFTSCKTSKDIVKNKPTTLNVEINLMEISGIKTVKQQNFPESDGQYLLLGINIVNKSNDSIKICDLPYLSMKESIYSDYYISQIRKPFINLKTLQNNEDNNNKYNISRVKEDNTVWLYERNIIIIPPKETHTLSVYKKLTSDVSKNILPLTVKIEYNTLFDKVDIGNKISCIKGGKCEGVSFNNNFRLFRKSKQLEHFKYMSQLTPLKLSYEKTFN